MKSPIFKIAFLMCVMVFFHPLCAWALKSYDDFNRTELNLSLWSCSSLGDGGRYEIVDQELVMRVDAVNGTQTGIVMASTSQTETVTEAAADVSIAEADSGLASGAAGAGLRLDCYDDGSGSSGFVGVVGGEIFVAPDSIDCRVYRYTNQDGTEREVLWQENLFTGTTTGSTYTLNVTWSGSLIFFAVHGHFNRPLALCSLYEPQTDLQEPGDGRFLYLSARLGPSSGEDGGALTAAFDNVRVNWSKTELQAMKPTETLSYHGVQSGNERWLAVMERELEGGREEVEELFDRIEYGQPSSFGGYEVIPAVERSDQELNYDAWVVDAEGLKLAGWFESEESEEEEGNQTCIFKPAVPFLPATVHHGRAVTGTSPFSCSGSEEFTGTISWSITAKGFETVTTSAGTFENCLKMVLQYEMGAEGEREVGYTIKYYAQGTGEVLSLESSRFGGEEWGMIYEETVATIKGQKPLEAKAAVPRASIVIDGQSDDWNGLTLARDFTGFDAGGQGGGDIKDLFLARDSAYLYGSMTFASGLPPVNATSTLDFMMERESYDKALRLDLTRLDSGLLLSLIRIRVVDDRWEVTSLGRWERTYPWDGSSVATLTDYGIEWKVPLACFVGLDGRYLAGQVNAPGMMELQDRVHPEVQISFASPPVTLTFPHVASTTVWETEMCVINLNATGSVEGALTSFDQAGAIMWHAPVTVKPRGRLSHEGSAMIAEPALRDGTAYAVFTADRAVRGYEKFRTWKGDQRAALPAVEGSSSGELIIPHIASNSKWWTGLAFVNTTPVEKSLTVSFNTGETKTVALGPFEHKAMTVAALFGGSSKPDLSSGFITQAEGVIGLELFGKSEGGTQLSGVLLNDARAETLHFPHVASNDVWWTGLVVANPSNSTATLTVKPYSSGGEQLPDQLCAQFARRRRADDCHALRIKEAS